ncbi:hypothetical protein RhiirB3_394664 [Rhizophagus irregularis]|nr:hypothetical protein RhiirB3_394664 [Rhizophagus irregularis]
METGILPSKDNESDEESNDGEDDVNAIIKLIEKEDQKDLEDVICPIKNVYLINIRNGVDFPNTRTLLYNICFNLIQDAEIENFRPHKKYDEIVETVRPNPSADDLQNEEEIIPVISLTEALINVET